MFVPPFIAQISIRGKNPDYNSDLEQQTLIGGVLVSGIISRRPAKKHAFRTKKMK